jgi:5-methylcytosine-specific restriction endonuclease McrA
MRRAIPIEIGKHYGRWAVIQQAKSRIYPSRVSKQCPYFLCRCDCGAESEVSDTALRNGYSKSCPKCATADGWEQGRFSHIVKRCVKCGKQFHAKSGCRIRCPECSKCWVCGKPIRYSHIDFCSKSCASMWKYFTYSAVSKGMEFGHVQGPAHPNWKGGNRSQNRTDLMQEMQYKIWRKSVLVRDKYTCQKCGESECLLRAHHIKHWAYFPTLRYVVANGVTLCKKCHSKEHKRRNARWLRNKKRRENRIQMRFAWDKGE